RAIRRAMSPSPARAVATKATRRERARSETAKRLFPLRAPPRTKTDEAMLRVLPRRPVSRCAPGQVSWLSDRPTPRAFPARRPVAFAGFVPDYSDGVAAAFNRLPWARRGSRGASYAVTVADPCATRNGTRGACCALLAMMVTRANVGRP